jgi:hypothetical protein
MKNANADHVVIPGGMTSQLQMLEVVISKPFKDYLWWPYNDLLPKNCKNCAEGMDPDCLGKISSESVVAGFKK